MRIKTKFELFEKIEQLHKETKLLSGFARTVLCQTPQFCKSNLAIWQYNNDEKNVLCELKIQSTTRFVRLPSLYFNAPLSESALIEMEATIRSSVPEGYDGIVLGNIFEKETAALNTKTSKSIDILNWVKVFNLFERIRPEAQLVNYGMPQLPYWSTDDWREVIKQMTLGFAKDDPRLPHWLIWRLIHGGSYSAYDPYDDEKTPEYVREQMVARNRKAIDVMNALFPNRPKVVNFWHRHASGSDMFALIDIDELYNYQVKPFLTQPGFVCAFWGGLQDLYFRSSKNARYLAATAKEYSDAGVSIDDKEECEIYHRELFESIAIQIHNRAMDDGLIRMEG
jgi:hypothetical protein